MPSNTCEAIYPRLIFWSILFVNSWCLLVSLSVHTHVVSVLEILVPCMSFVSVRAHVTALNVDRQSWISVSAWHLIHSCSRCLSCVLIRLWGVKPRLSFQFTFNILTMFCFPSLALSFISYSLFLNLTNRVLFKIPHLHQSWLKNSVFPILFLLTIFPSPVCHSPSSHPQSQSLSLSLSLKINTISPLGEKTNTDNPDSIIGWWLWISSTVTLRINGYK